MKIFTLYDEIAEISNGLFLANTKNEAIRIIENFYKSKKNDNFSPDDYSLWELGIFDEKKKFINSIEPKKIYPSINVDNDEVEE